MISGAHMVINSKDADADRAFFRDVLGFPWVDAGHGWLIFALPPSELACHPASENSNHEIYLMCEDVAAAIQILERRQVSCEPVSELSWGRLTHFRLPGGSRLGLYQPKHRRPGQQPAQ